MNIQNFENLLIPVDVLLNKELVDKEKIILSIILGLSKKNGTCYATNGYIADMLNTTDATVSRTISSLNNKKYVKVIIDNQKKNWRKREIVPIEGNIFKHYQNRQGGIDENDKGHPQNCQGSIDENDKYINNNIKYNKINDIPNRYKTDQYNNIDWGQYYAN